MPRTNGDVVVVVITLVVAVALAIVVAALVPCDDVCMVCLLL